jgi:nitrogen fixation protein FixH
MCRLLPFCFSHLAGILELFLEMLIHQNLKMLVNPPTYQSGQVVNMVRRVYLSPKMFLLMVF